MTGLLCDTHNLLKSLTTGVLVLAKDGKTIVATNPAFLTLSGYTEKTLLKKSLDDILSVTPTQQEALSTGTLFTKKEDSIKVRLKASALPTGETLYLIDSFHEDMQLIQAHSDFVSTVSHEFRTPLTSIKGFADTMLSHGENLEPEQQRRFVSIIKDQANRLIRLVENLLTVSKIGAKRTRLSYRPIALEPMVEKIVASIQAKISAGTNANRTFVITINPAMPMVWADADALEQVLINLIDNAVKYSKDPSTVTIEGQSHPQDESQILIHVRDEGIGIPAEKQENLFTKFYRVETPLTQEVEGTGLGLYITKSLTTAMGGSISVSSKPNQGSTFTLQFPAATPERQAKHRRSQYASNNTGKNDGSGANV